jgi:hypothetical protein
MNVSGFYGTLLETQSNEVLPRFGGQNAWAAPADVQVVGWSATLSSLIMSSGPAIEIFITHLDSQGTLISSTSLCTLNEFSDIFSAGAVSPPVTVFSGEAIRLRYTNDLSVSRFVNIDLWVSGSQ